MAKVTIEQISNGLLVTVPSQPNADGQEERFAFVIEEAWKEEDNRKNECKAFIEMFSSILYNLGYNYNGFSNHNIEFAITKGDEVEETDTEGAEDETDPT